ncbi:MAG: glycosyltransferase family 1 protein, partial [Chloroflexi bacterium]|nr:glycosyltransferase family 1 protein [Chloroflexota bacterium]
MVRPRDRPFGPPTRGRAGWDGPRRHGRGAVRVVRTAGRTASRAGPGHTKELVRMQATILALGSRGDAQPYIALGVGLRRAGHRVRVLATSDFHQLIRSAELDFFDMGGSMETVARSMEGLLEGGNMLRILASMGPAAERMIGQAAARGLEAGQGSDVIIAGLGGLPVGCALAEKLGIGFVPAYLYPFTPTSAFSSVLAPLPAVRLPGWANRLSHRLAQQMIYQAWRVAETRARRQVLGLPPGSFWGPFAGLERG